MKPNSLVFVAVDRAGRRVYLAGSRADCDKGALAEWTPGADLPPGLDGEGAVYVYPTRTYSEGLGSDQPADLSPEDRAALRALKKLFPGVVTYYKVTEGRGAATAASGAKKRSWLSFEPAYLRQMKQLFTESMTRPNRQDYTWLATKTFSFNLAVRLFFVVKAVRSGQLPVIRAAISTGWYQLQDAVFTVFGQTYMKFLGRMTGMVKVGEAPIGDLVFVYFQLCGFEFLNRLVLGPLGENPLVYTWKGVGLVFLNIFQGMISGGPLVPAVNQARRAGVISHSTMMHLYQVTSLTMQFGLFAAFGYQKFYLMLTSSVLVVAWGSYFVFTTFYKDPEFGTVALMEAPRVA